MAQRISFALSSLGRQGLAPGSAGKRLSWTAREAKGHAAPSTTRPCLATIQAWLDLGFPAKTLVWRAFIGRPSSDLALCTSKSAGRPWRPQFPQSREPLFRGTAEGHGNLEMINRG